MGRPLRAQPVIAIVVAAAALAALQSASSQTQQTATDSPVAIGLYNWVHTTADAEQSFRFYRDVLGVELTRSPFQARGSAAAPPEAIRPVAEAASDPLVWDLTDTQGSRFRTVFMRASNTPFGLELAEFFDIARDARPRNPWDQASSKLIFVVRDLDSVVATLHARGAAAVTLGGVPVATPAGRSLLVRDPDGYLVQLNQASAAEIATAEPTGEVIGTSIGITVADRVRSLAFYRDLLRFDIGETRSATVAELRLNGLADGALTETVATIPGIGATVLLSVFTVPTTVPAPVALRWRIQDVGAPQFQLQVKGLDALLARAHEGGYRFLSVGARPIDRPFGRFVFAIDPDGVLVEFVEPAGGQ